MNSIQVTDRIQHLETRKSSEEYNFEHFTTGILIEDAKRTFTADGICAGEIAPDFELAKVGGGTLRLSELRGSPVLMHFGSYS
ncbi:MAG: hypothetical protein WKF92_15070 [Pyrinomonadaceae bacterium]